VFGTAGTRERLYCFAHKRADDVNVANKKCLAKGCKTQPSYGPAGTKERFYCGRHKRADDVYVVVARKAAVQPDSASKRARPM
jgi:hypothetical protein